MTKLSYKLATGLTTGAIVLSAMAPAAFAATDIKIKGNGKKSDNTVSASNTKATTVQQGNNTAVVNLTGVVQNTGGNKANSNTGGKVKVKTGSTSSTVTNKTTTGGNVAVVDECGCEPADTSVAVRNSGKKSNNTVTVTNASVTTVAQSNNTAVVNGTLVVQNTGDNKANDNTDGNVKLKTGDTDSEVTNEVTTGGNEVTPVTP